MANGKIKGGELHIGVKFAIWIATIVFLSGIAYAGIKSNCNAIQECKVVRSEHEARIRNVENAVIRLTTIADAIENHGGKIFVRE